MGKSSEGGGKLEAADGREYRPRCPEESDLYRVLADHLNTFLARYGRDEPDPTRGFLRQEVRDSLECFLECAILRFGFARLQCGSCSREKLLALSCGKRGICPSCQAKRLAIWSDNLTGEMLPDVPYRQWVIGIPKRLRVYFRYDGTLFKALSRIVVDVLNDWMQTVLGREDVRAAVVACDQTFGTLLNYHSHQHLIVSEGAFTPEGRFIAVPKVRKKDLRGLEEAIRRRVLLLFTRRGKISPLTRRQMRAWEHSGFHVDGSVRISGGERKQLGKLLCYAHRHPFRNAGINYQPKTGKVLYRANKSHGLKKRNFEVFDAVEFLAVLADHIPHRGRHRVRYYGPSMPATGRRFRRRSRYLKRRSRSTSPSWDDGTGPAYSGGCTRSTCCVATAEGSSVSFPSSNSRSS